MISKLNMVIMKFEGDKPNVDDYVVIIDNKTVRKWELEEMSLIIGVRVPTARGYSLQDDEILIQLSSCIGNLNIENISEPLFTAKVDSRGRITIREDVRDRKNIDTGDKVNVFKLEKEDNKNL